MQAVMERAAPLGGCYALESSSTPDWLNAIERRFVLTLVPLIVPPHAEYDAFVARPAEGTPASWYPYFGWSLSHDGRQLEISWQWSGYDYVSARFEVPDAARYEALNGRIEGWSDDLSDSRQPVDVTLARAEC